MLNSTQLRRANDNGGLVIFLVSGGGSAMIEWPSRKNITLADLRAANKVLVKCGASIGEINSVRRAFSGVKGGRLAGYALRCDQITLIVSDVPTGGERNVASGPTLSPADDEPEPREVIARYDLAGKLPQAILRTIEAFSFNSGQDNMIPSSHLREHFVLLDNSSAVNAAAAAAKRRGFVTEITKDISDQPIEIGCGELINRLAELRLNANESSDQPSLCLISGGEFTCPVRGDGIGGRN